jgi:hypothetical protein
MNYDQLEQVRTSCRNVAERADYVRLNHDNIGSYASFLPPEVTVSSSPDPACHYLDHGDDTVAFFVTLDAINFGSGYFPYLRKRDDMSGYFSIASALNGHFNEHGPFSARELREITTEDCARIFRQDAACMTSYELMGLFARALNDLGGYLLDSFSGSFVKLVESAAFSADNLVKLLVRLPFFDDVASYRGINVKFFKRAQITAADLFLAFEGSGPGRFDDIDQLTIFADNLVPHVLRLDGILSYDPQLLSKIESEEEIAPGSPEEIEIRACAVHACELLVDELRRRGQTINSMQLDQFLWNRGQLPEFKRHPRHRTRTVFY